MSFSKNSINIDPPAEAEKIVARLKRDFVYTLRKRGAVVGVSGGVDSAVVLALCAKAFGPERVLAVMMPEKESSPENIVLGKKLIEKLDTEYVVEDITAALIGFGCYQRRDQAIKEVFPEYDSSCKAMLVLAHDVLEKDGLNFFHLKIISATGEKKPVRLLPETCLQIIAATNFKQRCRMCMLYHHAERRNYGVAGTANKNERELGFLVKFGDGGVDLNPIAHLFKTQIYQLAEYLDIPREIRERTPTSDTYGAEQTQEEFFFKMPFAILDRVWQAWEMGVSEESIVNVLNLTRSQVRNVIQDIQRKHEATKYLRLATL